MCSLLCGWLGGLHRRCRSVCGVTSNSAVWLLLAGFLGLSACAEERQPEPSPIAPQVAQSYVGSEACRYCHTDEYADWLGSHHQLAMQEVSRSTVLAPFADETITYGDVASRFYRSVGKFVVETDNADGALEAFTVRYTFGVAPLQQYLLDGDKGRLQALSLAWDSEEETWFHIYPQADVDHTDVRHWTRSSATWNHMCADCHSTALTKNFDAQTQTYATQWAEISVGCEACHGPGAQHIAWAQNPENEPAILPLTSPAVQINACAPCHSRRGQLAQGFTPEANLFDHYQPALLEAGLYHADGQILDEVYVYGSFVQSKMHAQGVVCTDCHNPHSGQLLLQGNALCSQCHNNIGRADFTSLPLGDYDNPSHHHHVAGSPGAQCRSCHMPERTYMVVDDRADHSFRIPRPDLTIRLGVPNACNQCHVQQTAAWAAESIEQWFGGERDEHFAAAFHAARRGEPQAEEALVKIAGDPQQPAIVRGTALSLLVGYNLRLSSSALEQGLKDAQPLVRIGALRGAARWPVQRRWRFTRSLLEDELLAVRVAAVSALMDAMPQLPPADQSVLRAHLQTHLETLQLAADSAEGQTNIASAYLALQDIPKAEAALRQSLEINPDWVPGMVNLADLLRGTGRDLQGERYLQQALLLTPDSPQVLTAAALWQVRNGSPVTALDLLERAWRAAPGDSQTAYLYMVALNSNGRAAAALQVADQMLANRDHPELLRLAFSIARDAAMVEKMREYQRRL